MGNALDRTAIRRLPIPGIVVQQGGHRRMHTAVDEGSAQPVLDAVGISLHAKSPGARRPADVVEKCGSQDQGRRPRAQQRLMQKSVPAFVSAHRHVNGSARCGGLRRRHCRFLPNRLLCQGSRQNSQAEQQTAGPQASQLQMPMYLVSAILAVEYEDRNRLLSGSGPTHLRVFVRRTT